MFQAELFKVRRFVWGRQAHLVGDLVQNGINPIIRNSYLYIYILYTPQKPMVAVGAETPCIWNHERWWITHLRSTQKVAKSSPKVSAFWMPRRRPGRKCHCQRGCRSHPVWRDPKLKFPSGCISRCGIHMAISKRENDDQPWTSRFGAHLFSGPISSCLSSWTHLRQGISGKMMRINLVMETWMGIRGHFYPWSMGRERGVYWTISFTGQRIQNDPKDSAQGTFQHLPTPIVDSCYPHVFGVDAVTGPCAVFIFSVSAWFWSLCLLIGLGGWVGRGC